MYPAHWIRVSDADRESVVAHLTAAVAEGRLTLEEFSERSQLAYASRTWGELAHLVGDLPAPPIADTRPTAAVSTAAGQASKLPLAALIVGITSIPLTSCAGLGGVAGLVAIVLGVVALRNGGQGVPGQRGMALAGLLCGLAGVLLQGAAIALFVFLE
ncbi:DUF1707 and DUF4190 domain-containing protein [Dactylosporangium sp. NPDC000521]|uniref:DUF1707 and DUF4190 domain-containing protein n=1 Tax=Dactylosporangium sp. NPDC000521 TaxID=3363975 RepID=UPI0036C4C271